MNVGTVLLGGGLGLLLRGRLPERITLVVMQAIGLVTVLIGVMNALDLGRVDEPPGLLIGLLALAVGGALGEAWRIEEGLERLGERLKRSWRGQGRFTEGFVAASLVFCVGPLTLLGSIQNGLTGEAQFLVLKSALDGFTAMALATTFGFGVLASALVIVVYQGGLSVAAGLFAHLVPDPAADPRVLLVNGVGGLMIVGLGLGLLEIEMARVGELERAGHPLHHLHCVLGKRSLGKGEKDTRRERDGVDVLTGVGRWRVAWADGRRVGYPQSLAVGGELLALEDVREVPLPAPRAMEGVVKGVSLEGGGPRHHGGAAGARGPERAPPRRRVEHRESAAQIVDPQFVELPHDRAHNSREVGTLLHGQCLGADALQGGLDLGVAGLGLRLLKCPMTGVRQAEENRESFQDAKRVVGRRV